MGKFTFTQTEIPGVVVIEPQVFGDDRGYFMETYQKDQFAEAGIDKEFVQDNQSRSTRGVLRGLHFQKNHTQGKLVRVTRGEVYDVAVDCRPNSATFGKWVGVTLAEENKKMFYIPEGFAHGFLVLSDVVDEHFHSAITFTLSNLNDSGVSTVTVSVFWCDFLEHLLNHIYIFGVFLLASALSRNFFNRVEHFHHLTTSVKSGWSIFCDLLLNFIVNSFLLTVYNFFHSLAFSVFSCNFSCYSNSLKVVFLANSHSYKAFSDLTDLFSFSFCCNNFSIV